MYKGNKMKRVYFGGSKLAIKFFSIMQLMFKRYDFSLDENEIPDFDFLRDQQEQAGQP
jgi:hypothetical protein